MAAFMASDPDNSAAIFRSFDRLVTRNLLYLQSRMQQLEAIQDELDDENLKRGDLDAARAASSWEDFEELVQTQEWQQKRMKLAMDIQKVTTRAFYNTARF